MKDTELSLLKPRDGVVTAGDMGVAPGGCAAAAVGDDIPATAFAAATETLALRVTPTCAPWVASAPSAKLQQASN